jgi:hypothetical protein
MSLVSRRASNPVGNEPEDLLPWDWAITPTSESTGQCPSRVKILSILGVVNVVTLVLGLLLIGLKSRLLARWRRNGQKIEAYPPSRFSWIHKIKPWMLVWLVQVVFVLAANVINGHIATNATGYDRERLPSIVDMALFYMLRPRIGWAGIGLMSRWSRPFSDAFLPTHLAEMALQLLGLYYKGRIVATTFTAPYFMKPDLLEPASIVADWTLMAYPSFAFVVCAGMFALGLAAAFFTKANPKAVFKFSYWCMVLCFAVDWMVVVGYVGLAGDLFCPARFEIQGVVWLVGTLLGLLFGTGI